MPTIWKRNATCILVTALVALVIINFFLSPLGTNTAPTKLVASIGSAPRGNSPRELHENPLQNLNTDDDVGDFFTEEAHVQSNNHVINMQPFKNVQNFLLFIGYPRSGSTLVGSLIDAHPHAIVANEYNLMERWSSFTPEQKNRGYIFHELYNNSRFESLKEQRAPEKHYFFHYNVKNQWQGGYDKYVKVIGDKKGSATTRRLTRKNSTLVEELRESLGPTTNLKFIHIIRNPFDNIATMTLRAAGRGVRVKARENKRFKLNKPDLLKKQMDIYFRLVAKNIELHLKYQKDILDMHYSQFIKKPVLHIRRICNFLNLDCTREYIKACTQILFKKETFTRNYIVWPPDIRNAITGFIEQVFFLRDMYSF